MRFQDRVQGLGFGILMRPANLTPAPSHWEGVLYLALEWAHGANHAFQQASKRLAERRGCPSRESLLGVFQRPTAPHL